MEQTMTTPASCDRCDMHGPELPTIQADLLNLHRAIHDFGWLLTEPLAPLVNLLAALTQRTTK